MTLDETADMDPLLVSAFSQEFGRLLDDGLLVTDREGTVLSANNAAIRFLGEGVSDRKLNEIFNRDELAQDVDLTAIGEIDQEFIFQPTSTVPRQFKVRIKQLKSGQIAIMLMDLTLQRNLEKVRRDFVANVSHELRSPLTSLAGFIETILSNDIKDRQTLIRFLKIMEEEAGRMSRLIDDLLSLSRVEVDEHIVPTQTVPLMEVVRAVIGALEDRALRRNMQIKMSDQRQGAKGMPVMYGNVDEMNEVFHNLIENAIKYGHDNTTISIELDALKPGNVVVSVTSIGDMISEKHLARLTERFYRVDKARSRQIGGTGLGLAIVKHIVNRHRGAMFIQSQPDGQTTFSVELPVISGS